MNKYKDYPIWWDSTLTVYNKFTDPQTQIISWYRTVLEKCFWKSAGNKISIGNTVLETNDTICRIPESNKYLNKAEWINTPNDLMNKYFTLGVEDIIVLGEVDDIIDEYTSGKRSTDLIAKYKGLQGCIEIQQSTDNTGIGRCNPHYYVRGI